MKNNFRYFLSAAIVISVVSSCKKDEHKIFYEGGTAPVLTASSTTPLILTGADAAKPSVKFTWTNPDYKFTTGLSSQDVTYILEVDTTGANFSSPAKQEISVAKDLSLGFTVKELNAVLAKLNLVENKSHNVEFRLKSSLAGGTVPLYSNVIKMVLTPYLDVAVPIPTNGDLWITGDATGAGWANPLGAPYNASQKFTKISNTLYELTMNMPGGGNYKLIQDNGQWGTQYHMLAGGTWSSGSFEKKDADPGFPGPPSSGTYKITVNFKTGLYSVVKQ